MLGVPQPVKDTTHLTQRVTSSLSFCVVDHIYCPIKTIVVKETDITDLCYSQSCWIGRLESIKRRQAAAGFWGILDKKTMVGFEEWDARLPLPLLGIGDGVGRREKA